MQYKDLGVCALQKMKSHMSVCVCVKKSENSYEEEEEEEVPYPLWSNKADFP